jgi:hypothetical protein
MPSKKVEAALLKQKEAKQKKVLFVLVPVFLGLAVWQGPKTYHSLMGGSTPPPTTAAPTTTALPPGSAPSTPGAGAVVAPSQLVDTDTPPSVLDGQLGNLGVFPGRDPFSGGAAPPVAPTAGASTTGGGASTSTATRTTARFEINGAEQNVTVAGTFPESDPIFKLISVTQDSALVGLASGKNFTNGDPSEQIKVGETLTVTGDDGSSFSIKLVSTS